MVAVVVRAAAAAAVVWAYLWDIVGVELQADRGGFDAVRLRVNIVHDERPIAHHLRTQPIRSAWSITQ